MGLTKGLERPGDSQTSKGRLRGPRSGGRFQRVSSKGDVSQSGPPLPVDPTEGDPGTDGSVSGEKEERSGVRDRLFVMSMGEGQGWVSDGVDSFTTLNSECWAPCIPT